MSDLKIFSDDLPINGKRIIVRLDLNVPISNSKIDDTTRIEVVEPFINSLIEKKAKNGLFHQAKKKMKKFYKIIV